MYKNTSNKKSALIKLAQTVFFLDLLIPLSSAAAGGADDIQRSMLQFVFYASIVILLLILIAPTRSMLGKLFELGLGKTLLVMLNGLIFLIKTIITSHLAILWHLTHSRENIFLVPEDQDVGGLFGKRKRGESSDE